MKKQTGPTTHCKEKGHLLDECRLCVIYIFIVFGSASSYIFHIPSVGRNMRGLFIKSLITYLPTSSPSLSITRFISFSRVFFSAPLCTIIAQKLFPRQNSKKFKISKISENQKRKMNPKELLRDLSQSSDPRLRRARHALSKAQKDLKLRGDLCNNVSHIYASQGDYERAFRWARLDLNICQQRRDAVATVIGLRVWYDVASLTHLPMHAHTHTHTQPYPPKHAADSFEERDLTSWSPWIIYYER